MLKPAHPALLHGDLCSGNFITGSGSRVWLIDPAVYIGCAEADLAMTELFGGGYLRDVLEILRRDSGTSQ